MKIVAILIALLVVALALYITDKRETQSKTIHMADSLDGVMTDSIGGELNSVLRYSDSVNIRFNDRIQNMNARINDINYRLDKINHRLDSIANGRQSD